MKIGLIGDIHTEDRILTTVLSYMTSNGIDLKLCTGDIVDGKGDVNECCRLLKENNVVCVNGNHDRWLLNNEMRDLANVTSIDDISESSYQFIQSLPVSRIISTSLGKLMLCHGLGKNDMAKTTPDDYGYAIESNVPLQELIQRHEYSLVICGHHHQRMVRNFENMFVINPGPLECCPGFAVIDTIDNFIHFYDVKADGECLRSLVKPLLNSNGYTNFNTSSQSNDYTLWYLNLFTK